MDEPSLTEREATAVNERMAAQMEERRRERPERRLRSTPPGLERRKVCSFCYQSGDHPTPAHCLRALDR